MSPRNEGQDQHPPSNVEMGQLMGQASSAISKSNKVTSPTIATNVPKEILKPLSSSDGKNEEVTKSGGVFSGKVVFACALYSFCSCVMVLTNKSLASSYNHLIAGDLNVMLVIFQAIVAVICVEFCKYTKLVEHYTFDLEIAKQWAPVNLFFCGMLFTGMTSLEHNTVPMVTVFKNIANITTTFGDWYFFGSRPELLVIVAFGIMLAGACLAAINDVEITFVGIFWMCANCLCTSGYILYMKFATKTIKMSKFGMVFYNNLLCVCFLVPVAFMWGEVDILLGSKAIHTVDYFCKNVFAGFIGFFLNFASLNCVSQTGPTTYAIIGSLNKIPTSFLGYFMFKTVITPQTWFFISVSMVGGFIYSYAKIRAGWKKQEKENQNQSECNMSTQSIHKKVTFYDKIVSFINGDFTETLAKKVLVVCSLYGFGSAAAILCNREFLSRFGEFMNGDLMIFPLVQQSILAVVIIFMGRTLRPSWGERIGFNFQAIRIWAPVNIFYCAMLFMSVTSLRHVTVPLMTVAKCLTNVMISDGDHYFFGTSVNTIASASLGILLLGACLTAIDDVEFTMMGLLWIGGSCLATAAYILYLNYAVKSVPLSRVGMIYYNYIISLFVLIPAMVWRGEIDMVKYSPDVHNWTYVSWSALGAMLGLLATVAGINCMYHTGPTTYAVVGSLSKVPVMALGYLIYGSSMSWKNWLFLAVSVIAGCLFFYARIEDSNRFDSYSQSAGNRYEYEDESESLTMNKTMMNPSLDLSSMDHQHSYPGGTIGGGGDNATEYGPQAGGNGQNSGSTTKLSSWLYGRPLELLGESGKHAPPQKHEWRPIAVPDVDVAEKRSPYYNPQDIEMTTTPYDRNVRFPAPQPSVSMHQYRRQNGY